MCWPVMNWCGWCDGGSWLRLQMSVVMSSISRSTVDCNSTTFWPQRSSSGIQNWSKPCTIAIYCATWNGWRHCSHGVSAVCTYWGECVHQCSAFHSSTSHPFTSRLDTDWRSQWQILVTNSVWWAGYSYVYILVQNVSVKHLSFSAEHPGYLILFRMHVSRKVADDWEALLDGVGLEMPTIKTCSENHSGEVESTVQAGLTKWCDGQSQQPPTWQVLLEAMDHAGIDPKNIDQLKKDLLKPPLTFIEGTYIHCICIL